jgi:transketolase
MSINAILELTKQIRYNILKSTTEAGTGHPTSSLSAVELVSQMFFGGFFQAELDNPKNINNDRLVFSKGHASPLLYSLYYSLGHVSEEELMSLRKFGSKLEGHPTMKWQYTEASTGSLGQGLGVACGIAIAIQKEFADQENYPNVWCLLGDSEMAEGSVWEAMNSAVYYKLNNLIAIVDMNRLGQRGETQLGHDSDTMKKRAEAFGWEVWTCDGHNLDEINTVYEAMFDSETDKPKMLIAKTIKGKGISFLEDKVQWHGKALSKEECEKALLELGETNLKLRCTIDHPMTNHKITPKDMEFDDIDYSKEVSIATRKAYGNALNNLGVNSNVVALDAEMSNSTFSEIFAKHYPGQYYEMFIAEQNMISVATGMSRMDLIPFVSTFAAFLSRAVDQIRMAQYSQSNLKIMGSHCGVSIGADGSSQMALEDIAIFRSILDSVVLYPCDAISTDRLVQQIALHKGISYLRCTRAETPVIYNNDEEFVIGGAKIVKKSDKDEISILSAGITLHESLKAYNELAKENIFVKVIDMYSVKPINKEAITEACEKTQALIVVEDHYVEGGLYEAVCSSGVVSKPVYSLAVTKMSCSGTPEELLEYMEIDAKAIVKKVKSLLKKL